MSQRVGFGYDVHAFDSERELILCGVKIPYDKGLLGHSDADVALHALIDALLGAAALGDIGALFPDSDPMYKDISSIKLLERTFSLLEENRFKIINVDITIVAEEPKLRPYIDEMRTNIAIALDTGIEDISVKATTTERLGFTGRKEGIAAYSVAMIEKI